MKSWLLSLKTTILVLLLPFGHLFGQVLQDSIYTQAEIIEDLAVLETTLKAVHPSLYEYQSVAAFDALFATARNQVKKEMTDWDFLNLLGPVIQSIGCGHTSLGKVNTKAESKLLKKLKKNSLDTTRFLPFRGALLENRLFIGEPYDTTLDKTTEILAINDYSVATLIEKMKTYPVVSNDGYGSRFLNYNTANGLLENVYRYNYLVKEAVRLKVKRDGQVDYLRINTFSLGDIKRVAIPKYAEQKWEKLAVGKHVYDIRGIQLFQHKKQKDICLLEIQSFEPDTEKRLAVVFDYLSTHQIKNLIIDLRGNTGGNVSTLTNLLSYTLVKPHTFKMNKRKLLRNIKKIQHKERFFASFFQQIHFAFFYKKRKEGKKTFLYKTIQPRTQKRYRNQLYILIDNGSFSASSIFSSIIQDKRRATLLGVETGGAKDLTNGSSYFFPKLPNSRCTVRIPRYRIDHQIKTANKGRGVQPDYNIPVTIESFKNGTDRVLDKTLELIKDKK